MLKYKLTSSGCFVPLHEKCRLRRMKTAQTNLKPRCGRGLVRWLDSVSRVAVYRLLPVDSGTRRGRVTRIRLSEPPAVRPMGRHMVLLVRRPHVPHMRGMVAWWVLARIIHRRSKSGVVRGRGRASGRRSVEPGGHVGRRAPVVDVRSRVWSRVRGGRVVVVVVSVGRGVPLWLNACRTL